MSENNGVCEIDIRITDRVQLAATRDWRGLDRLKAALEKCEEMLMEADMEEPGDEG